MAIASIRHKGLRQLHAGGRVAGLSTDFVPKLRRKLHVIETANTVDDIGRFPGWRLHPLKGDLSGFWSLTVNRNWRLIFRFENGNALDLDLIDYH